MFKLASTLLITALITGCTITQHVEPAKITDQTELCIIEDSKVRQSFLDTYKSALTTKGVKHKVVKASAVPESCVWTSTYTARWSWDLSLYMSYAEIKIFKNGKLNGEALYDSRKGSARLGKFINAEEKINELVNELMQYESAALFFHKFG